MAVLFLDPIALLLLVGLLATIGAVWTGALRRWLGTDRRWSVLLWPLPLVLAAVPAAAGGVLWAFGLVGARPADGTVLAAAVYAMVHLVPAVALTWWPPRWLLPGWARARLVALPAPPHDAPADAVPALQCRRGHGSAARWAWRVDAEPGVVSLTADRLRFRSVAHGDDAAVTGAHLDDIAIAELRFSSEGELRLEPPRGGWWSRHELDVALLELDRWRLRARRPWRSDGLVVFEVEGRRPVALWVGDVRALSARLPEPRIRS
jgi:hypothetical protein